MLVLHPIWRRGQYLCTCLLCILILFWKFILSLGSSDWNLSDDETPCIDSAILHSLQDSLKKKSREHCCPFLHCNVLQNMPLDSLLFYVMAHSKYAHYNCLPFSKTTGWPKSYLVKSSLPKQILPCRATAIDLINYKAPSQLCTPN